jgi:hypothetical protein
VKPLRPHWSKVLLGYRDLPHAIIEVEMGRNRFIFALFAAAILFSMVREWRAPTACMRTIFLSSAPAAPSRR